MARKSKMMKVKEVSASQKNIALYCRVSTRRQAEEGYSIDIQKEKLGAYIIAKYDKGCTHHFYVDDGYSGGSLDRPAMQQLMEDVKAHVVTDVIVYKLDRLSRSQKDTLYLIEDVFLENNVAFSSIQESFDTSTAQGRVVVGILSVFAQFERENIYERTRAGMKKRVEDGYWPGGGGVPFGYDYDPTTGILVPNQDADTVRQVFQMYLRGVGTQTIANALDLRYDKLVYQILTRKTYTGKMYYNGVEYQMRHKPLISEELFEEAQRLVSQRSTLHISPRADYLLSGLCVCGRCGAKMRYQKWGKAGAKIICYSRHKSKPYMVKDPERDNLLLWADDVEKAVLEDMFSYGQGVDGVDPDDTERMGVYETLILSKKTTENKIKRLIKLYAIADESTEEELQAQIQELQDKSRELEKRIQTEQERRDTLGKVDSIQEKMKSIKTMWPTMSDTERQMLVREAIDKVVIDGYSIRIDYKF